MHMGKSSLALAQAAAAAPHEMFSFISHRQSVATVACGNLFSDMKNVQYTEIPRGKERGGKKRDRANENCGKSLNNKIKMK